MDSKEQAAARTQQQQQQIDYDDDDDLGGSRPLPTEVDHPILRSLAEKTKLAFTRLSLAATIDEEVELEDGPVGSSRSSRLLDATSSIGRRSVVIMLVVVGTLATASTYIFSIRQDHKDFEKQVRVRVCCALQCCWLFAVEPHLHLPVVSLFCPSIFLPKIV